MSGAVTQTYPGGRTLAGWKRQLVAHAPERFWTGYLSFQRVEAPVLVQVPQKLPPFELMVLKAAAACRGAVTAMNLAGLLHLEPGLIHSVLRYLVQEGLLTQQGDVTEVNRSGQHAVLHGEYATLRREQSTLYFWHADWASPPSSQFVNLSHLERMTWLAAPPLDFAPEEFAACIGQDFDWKTRHRFPTAITELVPKPTEEAAEGLDNVVLTTPLRSFFVVARTRGMHGTILLGFSANTRNWELHASAPDFKMPEDKPGWFPPALPEEAVRRAFVEWCRQREISVDEAQAFRLSLEADRLRIEASGAELKKLRGSHGESWLLAGDGLVRAALQLEFV